MALGGGTEAQCKFISFILSYALPFLRVNNVLHSFIYFLFFLFFFLFFLIFSLVELG